MQIFIADYFKVYFLFFLIFWERKNILQTYIQTDRQTDRHIFLTTDIQTLQTYKHYRQTNRQTHFSTTDRVTHCPYYRQKYTFSLLQTDICIVLSTDSHILLQTDRQIDRKKDRQLDRQTDRQLDRQKDTFSFF